MTHFLVHDVSAPTTDNVFLVEFDNFHDSLRILFLFRTRYPALLKELLPLLREAGKLPCRRIEADMSKMNGIVRGADLGLVDAE